MDAQISEWVSYFLPYIIFLALFEAVFKLIALWRAARKKQLAWFIVLGIINTAGILPIIYLLLNKKEED
jgi:hypothetical protein